MKTLVIGSADIDLFLKLPQASSFVETQTTVTFNLGDKIPTDIQGTTLGGNGANVSAGTKRLGMDTSFYTFVGTDLLSRQIRETLEKEQIKLIDHEGVAENTSLNLIFDFSTDRIIFSHHEVKDHSFNANLAKDFEALYLTSIGREWVETYKQILSYIHSQQMSVAFSPGSPQLADLQDVIYEIIASCQILFVNKQEGEHILEKKGEKAQDIKELLTKLSVYGPHIVSVTDGKKGSFVFTEGVYYHIPPFDEKKQGVDKTGAGDAYASGFFSSFLLNGNIEQAMAWGGANANAVMGKLGAQDGLLTVSEMERTLATRPDFRAEKM